jgi:hypothetical protein
MHGECGGWMVTNLALKNAPPNSTLFFRLPVLVLRVCVGDRHEAATRLQLFGLPLFVEQRMAIP